MGRRRAIRKALARLGPQASNKEIVATLAECGIVVSAAMIRQVRVEMLKEAANSERQQVTVVDRFRRRQVRLPPKIPRSH